MNNPSFESSFQFLGIPPKGERSLCGSYGLWVLDICFQFLGIPPKGELQSGFHLLPLFFEGFQFLGIPPKGERLSGRNNLN